MCATTWKKYKEHKDFLDIITHIETIIYTQKFEGAAAGHYNANIIARDLGLADKKELDHSGTLQNAMNINIIQPEED